MVLWKAARKNSNVVALTADLAGSLKLNQFMKEFPDRFFQCGIAEANMMGIAAGLTIGGKIPYTTTFANFSTGRVYDQIRQSIALQREKCKDLCFACRLNVGRRRCNAPDTGRYWLDENASGHDSDRSL
jgi:transketolase